MSEPLVSKAGRVLTDAEIKRLAAEAEAGYDVRRLKPRRVGRPSLSGEAAHSPRITFRVTDGRRAEAEAEAERQGVSVSALARRAFDEYLSRHRAS